MVRKEKFLSSTDTDDVYDDVNDKKALPELILKANILTAQDVLLTSVRTMQHNFRMSGRFLKEDVIFVEGNLVLLWSFISQMVEEIGIEQADKRYYDVLKRLDMGHSSIKVTDLIGCKNYLLACLHRINITNLFQSKGMGFNSEIGNEY